MRQVTIGRMRSFNDASPIIIKANPSYAQGPLIPQCEVSPHDHNASTAINYSIVSR